MPEGSPRDAVAKTSGDHDRELPEPGARRGWHDHDRDDGMARGLNAPIAGLAEAGVPT